MSLVCKSNTLILLYCYSSATHSGLVDHWFGDTLLQMHAAHGVWHSHANYFDAGAIEQELLLLLLLRIL